jgi:hypothetical protein
VPGAALGEVLPAPHDDIDIGGQRLRDSDA